MTHRLAAQQCQATADFLSRMIRGHHIPEGDKVEACDRAIEMNLLAKAHVKEAITGARDLSEEAGNPIPDDGCNR